MPTAALRLLRPTWLELALDYRCNLRCLGCHACHDTGESMSTTVAIETLRQGRLRGASRLWLGGGEPTLRDDLLVLIRAARTLGYEQVLLQTNGMRLSYPAYRDALVAAGVSEVRFNVKSHRAELHDRISRAECHGLLMRALEGMSGTRVTVSADVLLTRSTLPDLPDLIPFFATRGITRFVLWLLSAADSPEAEVLREVPALSEIAPVLALADAEAKAASVELVSLHTPPCTLPPGLRHLFEPASSLGLIVSSSFEGGAYVDGCARCAERGRCGGPRADYVGLYGASEFVALPQPDHSPPASM